MWINRFNLKIRLISHSSFIRRSTLKQVWQVKMNENEMSWILIKKNKKNRGFLNPPIKPAWITRHFLRSVSYIPYLWMFFQRQSELFKYRLSRQSLKRSRFLLKTSWKYRIKFFSRFYFREKQFGSWSGIYWFGLAYRNSIHNFAPTIYLQLNIK